MQLLPGEVYREISPCFSPAGTAMNKRAGAADKDKLALEIEITIGTEAKDHSVKGCWTTLDDEENDDEEA